MSGKPRLGVGARGARQRLMNTERFFATAIGLAGDIDNRDNRALHRFIGIGVEGFVDHFCQRPAFEQANFTLSGAWVMVISIRYHGDKTGAFTVKIGVGNLHRWAQTGH